ncbi:MAG: hypothetical protein KGN80_11720, partial [Acidobacteriota bacterium]|nr:hypothetical protein [Acidobacteriota bacterium]
TFADILHLKAELQAERKQPFATALAEAQEALNAALKRDATSPSLWERKARMELLRTRLEPGAASRSLPLAESFLQNAEAHSAPTTVHLNLRARLTLAQANAASPRRGDADSIQKGLEAADQSMKLNPRQAEVRALRGALLAIRSRGRSGVDSRREDAKAAKREFEAALKINPLLQREWKPLLDEAERNAGR